MQFLCDAFLTYNFKFFNLYIANIEIFYLYLHRNITIYLISLQEYE